MPITEILKVKNVFSIEKSNNNMSKLINEFTDICKQINKANKENIYLILSQFYLKDIISKYQDEKEIIFNFEKTSTDLMFNIDDVNIKEYFKNLLGAFESHDYITLSRFYYLLSDLIEIYGIEEVEESFDNQQKQLKMTR